MLNAMSFLRVKVASLSEKLLKKIGDLINDRLEVYKGLSKVYSERLSKPKK